MRVLADKDNCLGSGHCVIACSEVFAHDDEGRVVVLQEHPEPALHDGVRAAVDGCPSAALSAEED